MSDGQQLERKGGRPTKINADIVDAILPVIAQGIPWTYTAHLAGVTEKTISNWLRRGEEIQTQIEEGEIEPPETEPDSIYLRFFLGVTHAREKAITRNLLYIQQSARGGYVTEKSTRKNRDGSVEETEKRTAPDWRAAAKFLQYAAPRDFGDKPQQVEMSGPGGGAIQVEGLTGIAAKIAARQQELDNVVDAEVEEDE
jgi:hypothetical protein